MKTITRILFSFIIVFVAGFKCIAHVVYVTQYRSQANVIIYITKNRAEATLLIRKTDSFTIGKQVRDWWFYTPYQTQATLIVFYTNKRVEAKEIVYFY